MKKALIALTAIVIAVGLTGCGLTWEELAADKERCEALGGKFKQWEDGLAGNQHADCIFDDGKGQW